MKHLLRPSAESTGERGAAVIYVAILLVVLLGVTALAVDVGYMMVVRNQLQNAADAAALAAARKLGSIYEPLTYAQQQSYVCTPTDLSSVAQAIALENVAGLESVKVLAPDVIIGQWDSTTHTLTPTYDQPDAVQVTARRDDTVPDGPIPRIFGVVFRYLGNAAGGISISATATAALTGQGSSVLGGVPIPVGISQNWFDRGYSCGDHIQFYPTASCAGWHNYFDATNTPHMRRTLDGLKDGTFQSPPIIAGVSIVNFTGGVVANLFENNFLPLFNTMKVKNDGVLDRDTNPLTWTTTVVVYEEEGRCDNPNQSIKIVGFATVVIRDVIGPSSKDIVGNVLCDNYQPGRGGGGEYGTMGTIPGLVR